MTQVAGFGVFLVIVGTGLALDHRNRRTGAGPTFRQALRWLRARFAGRAALFALWAFAGWHFFVR